MEGIKKQSTAENLPSMLEGQRSLPSNPNFIPRLGMPIEREQSLNQNLENMPELQLKEEEAPKRSIKQFVERTKIVLRNATQDNEDVLTTGSVFSLESLYQGVGYLSVKLFHNDDKADKDAFKWADGPSHKYHGEALKFFQARFHKKNPLEKEEFEVVYSTQSDKYFHLTGVVPEEISEVLVIQSQMYPLIKVLQETKKIYEEPIPENQKFQEKGKKMGSIQNKKNTEATAEHLHTVKFQVSEAVRKLNAWLEGADPGFDTGYLHSKVKQKMFRELGLIDVLLDALAQFFLNNLLVIESKDLAHYKPLAQAIFGLLQNVIAYILIVII